MSWARPPTRAGPFHEKSPSGATLRCCASLISSYLDLIAALARGRLRQVVFEHDKNLPLVAIRVTHPTLVLQGIAATRLHFIPGQQSRVNPLLPCCLDVGSRFDLNSQMRERATLMK